MPPGTILSDMLFGTPIFMEEGAGGGGEAAGGGGGAAPRSEHWDSTGGQGSGPAACAWVASVLSHSDHDPGSVYSAPMSMLLCPCALSSAALAKLSAALQLAAPVQAGNVVDGFDYGELGVDPTLDPELVGGRSAWALWSNRFGAGSSAAEAIMRGACSFGSRSLTSQCCMHLPG